MKLVSRAPVGAERRERRKEPFRSADTCMNRGYGARWHVKYVQTVAVMSERGMQAEVGGRMQVNVCNFLASEKSLS